MVGQLPEVLPEQPAAVLAEDGHRRADAGGLLHEGNIVAVIKTILRQPLLIADPILLQLRHDVAVDIEVAGDGGGAGLPVGVSGGVGIGQLLPDFSQVLRAGEAEEHQQQGGQHLDLKPDLARPPGQSHVRPLLVLSQQDVHQEHPSAHTGADGLLNDPLPPLVQTLFDVVQCVVLVGAGAAIVALDKNLRAVHNRHGHLHLGPRFVHREVLVAGDIPLIAVLPFVKVVVAAAVDVQLLPIQPCADLLPIKLQEESVAL